MVSMNVQWGWWSNGLPIAGARCGRWEWIIFATWNGSILGHWYRRRENYSKICKNSILFTSTSANGEARPNEKGNLIEVHAIGLTLIVGFFYLFYHNRIVLWQMNSCSVAKSASMFWIKYWVQNLVWIQWLVIIHNRIRMTTVQRVHRSRLKIKLNYIATML